MNFKSILLLLLTLSLIVALAACNNENNNQTCAHVDADDDYLCDKCGEHFDDGDETGNVPEVTSAEVSFVVKFTDGKTLSGAKFTLTRGDKVYSLETGADGTVKETVDFGTYEVYVEYESLPEYCWADTWELTVSKETETLEIIIVDNTPNGSSENPFWLTMNETEISVAPGEELYFNYRGSTLKNITIEAEGLELNFNGNTYSSVDGILSAQIAPSDVGQISTFTIKNTSTTTVNAVMKAYAPLGAEENPFQLTSSEATATVAEEQIVYYTYTAQKDGVLLLLNKTEGGSITVTRNLLKYIEGFTEPIIIPILAQTNEGSSVYAYVKAGDEIKISVSYTGDFTTDGETHDVEFSVALYEATEADPVPVFGDDLYISLDAGASVVFAAAADGNVMLSVGEAISVSLNGENMTPDANGNYNLSVKAYDKITVQNNSVDNSAIDILF